MRAVICLTILICLQALSKGQTTVIFMPVNQYFFSSEQMWNFQVVNSGKKAFTGKLEITLYRNSSIFVKSVTINNTTFEQGVNIFSIAEKNLAITQYGTDDISNAFRNTNILAPGIYSICVSITNELLQAVTYGCNEIVVSSFTLPVLLYPTDEAQLNTTLPVFSWLPVMPGTIYDIKYQLNIWESGKSPALKVGGNMVDIITSNTNFQYTDMFAELVIGKNYSWNISAFSGDYFLGATENWTFKLSSLPLTKEAEVEEESFRNINDHTTNAEYTINNTLKIAYQNAANDSLLSFQIYHKDSLLNPITGLPEITLKNGKNLIMMDLVITGHFISEEYYTMEINDANGKKYVFNFKYIEL